MLHPSGARLTSRVQVQDRHYRIGETVAHDGIWRMSGDAPFRLGPFAVDEAGRLSPAEAADMPAFRLRWRDRAVHVRMAQAPDGSDSGVLALRTILGRVPSTAERAVSREGAAWRRQAFSVMLGLPGLLPRA